MMYERFMNGNSSDIVLLIFENALGVIFRPKRGEVSLALCLGKGAVHGQITSRKVHSFLYGIDALNDISESEGRFFKFFRRAIL